MEQYDVVIVGGSYAGLAAAMALGRSLRKVLVIDSGMPCNRQTPHSHNFITQDGETPAAVAAKARKQVEAYPTVHFLTGKVIDAVRKEDVFDIATEAGEHVAGHKLLFATGLQDIMPDITGYADCWGISVIHCPYCHGYEVRGKKLGVIASGDMAIEYIRLIHQLSKDLVLFTNGPANLKTEHREKLSAHHIPVIETPIVSVTHKDGYLTEVVLDDGNAVKLNGLFNRPDFRQHCDIPEKLGCLLTKAGYLHADEFGKTNVPGVFVAGDNNTMMRSLAAASAAGNKTGAWINKELAEERF